MQLLRRYDSGMSTPSFYEHACRAARAAEVRALLKDLGKRAREHERLQAEFTEQIKRNRARREGKPVKLSQAGQQWQREAAEDARKASEGQAERIAKLSDLQLLNVALSGWDFVVQLIHPTSYHEDDQAFAERMQRHARAALRLLKDYYRTHGLPLPTLASGGGIAFTTAFRRALPELGKLGTDCLAIEPALAALDKLAQKAQLAALSEFVNHDPHGMLAEKPPWFDPAASLATVRGLLDCLARSARAVKNSSKVVQDLQALEKDLVQAQQHKVKFHFLMLD